MNTILVAGASGFIGSNLCRALLARDNRVIGIDDYSTSDGSNLLDLVDDKNFDF